MPKPCTWVVKLGGAMVHDASFAHWLQACAKDSQARCVVVVGGGRAADEVRALHARWRFDEQLAHALAINAMRTNARVAGALAPALVPFSHVLPGGRTAALWLPDDAGAWLGVPASWSVTSDSLAVALAAAIDADATCLVKSCALDGMPVADVDACATAGLVDTHLPQLLRRGVPPVLVLPRTALADFVRARAAGEVRGSRLVLGQATPAT